MAIESTNRARGKAGGRELHQTNSAIPTFSPFSLYGPFCCVFWGLISWPLLQQWKCEQRKTEKLSVLANTYSDRDKSWPICYVISQRKSVKTYPGHWIYQIGINSYSCNSDPPPPAHSIFAIIPYLPRRVRHPNPGVPWGAPPSVPYRPAAAVVRLRHPGGLLLILSIDIILRFWWEITNSKTNFTLFPKYS